MTTARRRTAEPPRISVMKVSELIDRYEAEEVTGREMVEEMRAWLGDWIPPALRHVEPDLAEVDALLAGRIRYHQAHPQNRLEVLRRLQRRDPGISASRLAERLDVDARTIRRLRSRLREVEDSK